MIKRLIKVISLFLILFIFSWFYYINSMNYDRIKQIKYTIVKHPEFLPKKDMSKYLSFWFSNLRADIYWLEAIQYIWWNAVSSEYKKYLFSIIDLITQLNPYFEKPYLIWQLLLPTYNDRYEDLSIEDQNINIKQAEEIGLKWISNFCDEWKIKLIKNQDNLQEIWSNPIYKNPCKTSDLAFWQWFLYYFYLKQPKDSADFYKIASANDDWLEWAKTMAAIMNWKSWDREKSIMMFLTLVDSLKQDNKSCEIFSSELQKVSYLTFREQIPLSWEVIKNIDKLREENFSFNKEDDKKSILLDDCSNYINKAVRELNLAYIEQANKKYFQDKKINAKDAKILFDQWYLDYLPVDFQQYDDYGIIYFFNEDNWNFDYKMGEY